MNRDRLQGPPRSSCGDRKLDGWRTRLERALEAENSTRLISPRIREPYTAASPIRVYPMIGPPALLHNKSL